MCRMILAVGDVQLYSLLQDLMVIAQDRNTLHELNRDLGLGSWTHGDGWGVAYIQRGQWVVIKSLAALFNDPEAEMLRSVSTSLAVLHARKKMCTDASFYNTHPFVETDPVLGECVFCHNGYIDEEITYDRRFKPKGDTDSERLFCSILTETQQGDLAAALRSTFHRHFQVRGTNVIIAAKEFSVVGVKQNVLPQYYRMAIGRSDKLLLVSSEKLPSFSPLKWTELEAGDILTVDHKTLGVKVEKEREVKLVLKKLP